MSKPAAFSMEDDDDWQSMPVESNASSSSDAAAFATYSNSNDLPYGDESDDDSSDPDDPRRFKSWPSRSQAAPKSTKTGTSLTGKAKKSWIRSRLTSSSGSTSTAAPAAASKVATTKSHHPGQASATNATGKHLNIDDARGYDWRSKPAGYSSDTDEDEEGDKEKGYTQLRIDEDDESEQLHAATEYLFQDGSGGINGKHDPYGDGNTATPLSQMNTTKQLLSEGQKIAYVGLCSLAAGDLVRALQRVLGKELDPAKKSIESWKVKVMARLYQHMEIESSEQSMIESLATHGVLPTDLAPSLITTQTISNPEFDPEALREREEDEREEREQAEREAVFKREREEERQQAEEKLRRAAQDEAKLSGQPQQDVTSQPVGSEDTKSIEPQAEDPGTSHDVPADDHQDEAEEEDDDGDIGALGSSSKRQSLHGKGEATSPCAPAADTAPTQDFDEFDGDIGAALAEDEASKPQMPDAEAKPAKSSDIIDEESGDIGAIAEADPTTPRATHAELDAPETPIFAEKEQDQHVDGSLPSGTILADPNTAAQLDNAIDITSALEPAAAGTSSNASKVASGTTTLGLTKQPQAVEPPPGALDGVTTSISSADKTITLDLRWTVLCDLFLVLTADSVYDARSRVLLETVAAYLGLTWMDVTKFEKRVTDALEIEEGVESLKDRGALKRRQEVARKRRLMMMGLATVGGGLVIGLSAGLLAPVIGAGVGAALGAVGIGGTSSFLGGIGGAALITTTGTVGGMSLGGHGMSRRTRNVKTFEFKSIHNNKRVNAIVTVPGFMNGAQDDVRLPFSVIDSIMGDVFSVLWEPDMMQEMGNALGILWNETLVQGVQQVLAATVAGAMFSALAWPLWLTKLGYLIDNPWSNALDRAHAGGLILADILSRRQLGVRPITLVGYSLGARVIFYCLVELARMKAYGIVQNVYIMGAPVTAKDEVWKEARSVVSGRFVSAFSRTDWILGYLHRAASGGMRSIAGLHPVERVQEIENVDVTHVVPGHLQYRALMPLVLSELGFKTTADYFDEPEDISKIPERQVVREDSDYELKTVKTQSGGFGKIWKRKGAAGQSGESSKLGSPSGTPATNEKGEAKPRSGVPKYEYDEDDDDLPPRIEHSEQEKDALPPSHETTAAEPASEGAAAEDSKAKSTPAPISVAKAQALTMEDPRPMTVATPEADKPPSRGVHFDTESLLAELRESGIEVKELESSLPPLVASTSTSLDTTPKKKDTLELPSAAFSAGRTPSPSKAASRSMFQPPSSSQARRGSSSATEMDVEAKQPAPYARAFSSMSSSSGDSSFDSYKMPPPEAAGNGSAVSLSFASYDDDEIEVATPSHVQPASIPDERLKSYGLSSQMAKELEDKFRGGASSAQSSMDPELQPSGTGWTPTNEASGWSLPSMDAKMDIARPDRPYEFGGAKATSSTFGLDGGLGFSEGFNPLAPPSFGGARGFGSDAITSKAGFGTLDESFLSAATRTSQKKSASSSNATSGGDPWADNPWGGGY